MQDNTLPFWLSPNYRGALLKDSFSYLSRGFAGFAGQTRPSQIKPSLIEGLRLLRKFAQKRMQCRHIVKHETIWELLREDPPQVIVDIGSFDGLDALEFSRMFPDAKVFAFEADPRNYQLVKNTVAVRQSIIPIQQAVFNFSGEGVFHASDSSNGDADARASGSMLAPATKFNETFPHLDFSKDFRVKTTTLADWAQQYNVAQIDLIWMDAQGAELQILEGMGDLLHTVQVIFLEVWKECWYEGGSGLEDIQNYLKPFGLHLTHTWLEGNIGDALFQRNIY